MKVTFTFDYAFYYILYASRNFAHEDSILSLPCHALAQAPKINRGSGRTDIILEDILDHHMTFHLQINCNKLNKCNYRKSCNIYLLTAQYYFAIKKVLIKSWFVQV